jgi:cell fate regulator YaaT (PSP1 superfamily)
MAYGHDDDGPPSVVVFDPDLPVEPPADDADPLTFPLIDAQAAQLGDVASACGVRFVAGGRLQWFDAGDGDYEPGERVLVDSDRGSRLGWIAASPQRRSAHGGHSGARGRGGMPRVIRRANEQDLRGEREGDGDRARALRVAKDKAAALRLPLKVFRVELSGQLGRGAKLNVYYTCDERVDLRDFIRDVGNEIGGARIELRQLGARDEAKVVGGIGSCGLTLCCTTWLPEFVPVSIKMAKDQGLVLSPTKVAGQCGRLKCCLVYEQAAYAELRKGLPKLGKRVIGVRGEGRVVEVDVLRQRVRVSYGPGDSEVVPAAEVKALFPSGNQPRGERDDRRHDHDPPERHNPADDTDDPSALAAAAAEQEAELEPTDDPSAYPDLPDEPTDDPSAQPDDLADVPDLPDGDPTSEE